MRLRLVGNCGMKSQSNLGRCDVLAEEVAYGQYAEAYRAIHSALSGLMAPSPGKKITKLGFAWNLDGTLKTLLVFDNAELLFTLAFTWNIDGSLKEVSRS
jgi:hypothetical protein